MVKGQDERYLKRTLRYAVERHGARMEADALSEEIRRKNKDLEELNRVKDQFLGMAAHDMRAPMAVVIGFAKLLRSQPDATLTQKQKECFQHITGSSELITALLNDLLDVHTIDADAFQLSIKTEDIGALVAQAVTSNQTVADKKQIEIAYESSDQPALVAMDTQRILQVLNNYLTNAVKFSHPHTQVQVLLADEGQFVRVSIQDQGQGIPEEELQGIFDPFTKTSVQATNNERSTGLGLNICKRIVTAHGGRVGVESDPGQGSTFWFTLQKT